MDKVYIIKIGGQVIDDTTALDGFLDKFCQLQGKKVLVHGGGKTATTLCQKLGIPVKMDQGRRITDQDTMEVVSMVYAGLNKKIVAKLQSRGSFSLGLCGADCNVIPAVKRVHDTIDFGFVGDIRKEDVKAARLRMILDKDMVPVFCALTHDGKGNLLNTNADTIAATLAMTLTPFFQVSLLYCFEKKGVLTDADNGNSWLSKLTYSDFQKLKEHGIISRGMIPKLDNAFEAARHGAWKVAIKHADHILDDIGTVLYDE